MKPIRLKVVLNGRRIKLYNGENHSIIDPIQGGDREKVYLLFPGKEYELVIEK